MSSIVGEFVTETFDYDGGRQVTVYVPPDRAEAVVFAGDGQVLPRWGGVLEAADVPSTLVVGVHRLADETLRLHEYSPRVDPERFAAHERFFVEDVRRWGGVAVRGGAARRANRGVRSLGGCRVGARLGASVSGRLRRDLLRLSRRGLPTACRDAEFASARVLRCRHAGAVLPRERDSVGSSVARGRRGRGHDRAGRIARRRVLATEAPTDGGGGVRTMTRHDARSDGPSGGDSSAA